MQNHWKNKQIKVKNQFPTFLSSSGNLLGFTVRWLEKIKSNLKCLSLANYFLEKVLASGVIKQWVSVDVLLDVLLYSLFTCHPQAKEKQEELAMDMKILEKLLDDTRNEVKEETQRKVCTCFKWF